MWGLPQGGAGARTSLLAVNAPLLAGCHLQGLRWHYEALEASDVQAVNTAPTQRPNSPGGTRPSAISQGWHSDHSVPTTGPSKQAEGPCQPRPALPTLRTHSRLNTQSYTIPAGRHELPMDRQSLWLSWGHGCRAFGPACEGPSDPASSLRLVSLCRPQAQDACPLPAHPLSCTDSLPWSRWLGAGTGPSWSLEHHWALWECRPL